MNNSITTGRCWEYTLLKLREIMKSTEWYGSSRKNRIEWNQKDSWWKAQRCSGWDTVKCIIKIFKSCIINLISGNHDKKYN